MRKFTFGNNGAEFTHDVLIKYQAMTCGFNIPLLRTQRFGRNIKWNVNTSL